MKTSANKNQKGFTLIELLVVIGILAVLLAIVLIAINPARQFSQANDTKRRSDLNAILNAIHQYGADNRGNLTALGLSVAPQVIANDPGQESWVEELCDAVVPTYIAGLPSDPTQGTGDGVNGAAITDCAGTYSTGYSVSLSDAATGRVVVSASGELETDLSVMR